MRRRTNSYTKSSTSNHGSNSGNSNSNSSNNNNNHHHHQTTIELTDCLSLSPAPTRKRRKSISSSAATNFAVAAAEKVASSIDLVCSSGSTSGSEEDEEKQPLVSLHLQNEAEEEELLRQQQKTQTTPRHSRPSFPRIDLNMSNLNMNMSNLNMNMNMNMNIDMNMENFDFNALPIEIQMALEDTLLGWTHLTSITIGHVLLPWLVFYTVQRASKYVLETTVYTTATARHGHPEGSAAGTPTTTTTTMETMESIEGELGHAIEAVLVSPTTHALLGAVAAVAAFRVIRNHRKVWFRHAYGSKAYKDCEEGRRRREAVLETDRSKTSLLSLPSGGRNDTEAPQNTTWTSQMVKNYKRKRHKKKMLRASVRFERHHSSSPKHGRHDRTSVFSVPTTRTKLNAKPPRRKQYWPRRDDYESTSVSPTEEDFSDSSSSSCSSSDDDGTAVAFGPQICENHPSIAHDAVSIPRIHNVPYAHGGFFGAAPFFLADKRWVKILRELLPDVYVEISRRVGGGYYYGYYSGGGVEHRRSQDASKLIHWAENNPVVAAYGVVMDLQIKKELASREIYDNNRHQTTDRLCRKRTGLPGAQQPPKGITGGTKNNKTRMKLDSLGIRDTSGTIIDQFYQNQLSGSGHNRDHFFLADATTANAKKIDEKPNISNTTNDASSNANATTTSDGEEKMVIPNLEWDIFVDPQLVRRVEAVLVSIEKYIATKKNETSTPTAATNFITPSALAGGIGGETKSSDKCVYCVRDSVQTTINGDENDDTVQTEAVALLADHDKSMNGLGINKLCGDCFQNNGIITSSRTNLCHNTNFFAEEGTSIAKPDRSDNGRSGEECDIDGTDLGNDPVLQYLRRELKRRTQELTDRLLIAHGNVLQLLTEQAGFLKDWNYSRVQRTRRTLGGGMYARQWMAVFAESLRLGMKPRSRKKGGRNGGRERCANHEREFHNFYDEEDDIARDVLAESDALLTGGEDRDCMDTNHPDDEYYHADDDDDDDHDDPIDDDRNHCSCSPRCCLDTSLAESLELIERITQTKQPVGILLDLKSRHVPKRVLSLMVQCLQEAGIRVVGIASFQISEIRGVCSNNFYNGYCYGHGRGHGLANGNPVAKKSAIDTEAAATTTKEILMVHSAGDLQAACDEGLVQPGDHVFFNGGSLILDSARSSTIKSLLGFFFDMCVCGYINTFDPCVIEDGYRIQSYGYACSSMDASGCFNDSPYDSIMGYDNNNHNNTHNTTNNYNTHNTTNKRLETNRHDDDDDDDTLIMSSSEETEMGAVMRTLADYKRHYRFSMGLYLQEFSIDEAAARLLIDLVNNNPSVYDLGLAWGGINGMTVHGIQPGRFTSTDGYWNQRRLGRRWKDQF